MRIGLLLVFIGKKGGIKLILNIFAENGNKNSISIIPAQNKY